MIIPGEFIQWEHGISGVAFCVSSAVCIVIGYLWKDLKDVKECKAKQDKLVDKRIGTMEKCIAVMKERDEGYRNTLKEIKEDVGRLFGKMEDVRVAVASIAKNGD